MADGQEKSGQKSGGGFGCRVHARVLAERLRESFVEDDKPLVVGVYGEWGAGKTFLLEHIQQELKPELPELEGSECLTIPVLFNPWRHEAEEHLIIPLLKTAQVEMARYAGPLATGDEDEGSAASRLGRVADILKDTAVALSAGLSGKFSLLGQELKFDISKILKEDALRKKLREGADKEEGAEQAARLMEFQQALEKSESIYFDLTNHLEAITRPGDGTPRLNIVFLIDDLDRCMPEKAVQMLESVKLFLDVKGCAFALALDEQVVDRGIEHHYQAYRDPGEGMHDSIAHAIDPDNFDKFSREIRKPRLSPITGAEYLEKLINLPFHLPVLETTDVKEFLRGEYEELFVVLEKPEHGNEGEESKDIRDERGKSGVDDMHGRRGVENVNALAWREQLLELFVYAIPHVPRKLIRAANHLLLTEKIWRQRDCGEFDMLTLARICLLQLFAPELYRFGRRNYWFAQRLEAWAKEKNITVVRKNGKEQSEETLTGDWSNKEFLQALLAKPENCTGRNRELGQLLSASLENRSGFDVRRLFDEEMNSKTDEPLLRYFTLRPAIRVRKAVSPAYGQEQAQVTRLENRDEFFSQLFSGDSLLFNSALQTEAENLQGKVLSPVLFESFLSRAREGAEVIDDVWLEGVSPYLSLEQYERFLRETGIIETLLEQLKQVNATI